MRILWYIVLVSLAIINPAVAGSLSNESLTTDSETYGRAVNTAIATSRSSVPARFSVAGGVDFLNAPWTPYIELRRATYFSPSSGWSAYLGMMMANQSTRRSPSTFSPRVGAELFKIWFNRRFVTGLGITLAEADTVVGTVPRYSLRFGLLLGNGWSVELVHESNCSVVCDNSLLGWIPHGPRTLPNHGYNILVIRYAKPQN